MRFMPGEISLDRLAVGGDQLADLLSISARTRRTWSEAGKLPEPTLVVGRVKRWSVAELQRWLDSGAPRRAEWEARRRAGGAA